jgi:hypothetical protein
MQSASQLPSPGSRTLAQWWRQLQPYRPGALWIGYTYLHRIESTVRASQPRKLEPLARLILQALKLEPKSGSCCAAGECLHRLQERLQLPNAVLRQILVGLEKEVLVQENLGENWTITERGQRALDHYEYLVEQDERRIFPFLERVDERGHRVLPPHYAPLGECPSTPWHVQNGEGFDPTLLVDSMHRPLLWKQEFGFPADVEPIDPPSGSVAMPPWRDVIIDRPEQALLALTLPADASKLLGFAVRVESWMLLDAVPVLQLPLTAAQELWPALRADLDPVVLKEAWLAWCRQRSFPIGEASSCELSYQPGHLEVQAPERFLQRLRSARSDVFKGESWLLLGEGHLRPAVVLQVRARSRADAGSH